MTAEINRIYRIGGFQLGKFHVSYLLSVSTLLSVLFIPLSTAQHEIHDMPGSGAAHMITMPDNNAVLNSAPESIMLHFEADVTLLKLALRDPSQGREPIDIGFRFRPVTGVHFVQPLPVLPIADYYSVEWAAFDTKRMLIKGVFYFSFGDDAQPPSSYRNQMEHSMEILSPDYRLQ